MHKYEVGFLKNRLKTVVGELPGEQHGGLKARKLKK